MVAGWGIHPVRNVSSPSAGRRKRLRRGTHPVAYKALSSAPDDKTRTKLIAEAFERLEERYPHLPDLATQGHVRESELMLLKEIEQLRGEVRESELRLRKEIEQVKADLLKWIVPLMFAQVAAIAALVKLL